MRRLDQSVKRPEIAKLRQAFDDFQSRLPERLLFDRQDLVTSVRK